jgi:hypothetical protein
VFAVYGENEIVVPCEKVDFSPPVSRFEDEMFHSLEAISPQGFLREILELLPFQVPGNVVRVVASLDQELGQLHSLRCFCLNQISRRCNETLSAQGLNLTLYVPSVSVKCIRQLTNG